MEFRLQNMRGLFLTVFLFQIRTLYLFEIVKVVIQSTTALNIVEYGGFTPSVVPSVCCQMV